MKRLSFGIRFSLGPVGIVTSALFSPSDRFDDNPTSTYNPMISFVRGFRFLGNNGVVNVSRDEKEFDCDMLKGKETRVLCVLQEASSRPKSSDEVEVLFFHIAGIDDVSIFSNRDVNIAFTQVR